MNKSLFFFIAIGLDFFTKLLAYENVLSFRTKFLAFYMVKNHGFALGSFQDSSPLFRMVFHSIFGLYLTSIVLILLYLLRYKNLNLLKYSMISFFVGILGNTIDKIIYGHVVDFINLRFLFFSKVVFNLADVFLAFGSITLMYAVVKDFNKIWRNDEKRGKLLIDNHYQRSSITLGLVTTLSLGLIMGIYSYTLLGEYLKKYNQNDEIWFTFIIGLLIIFIGHGLITAFLFLKQSHHSAGPLIALKNFLETLQNDPDAELKLRNGDFHQILHECAEQIKKLTK
jgi:signal peptidase II